MANAYIDKAKAMLQGSFDTAKSNLQNGYNQNIGDVDNQIASSNEAFDTNIKDIKHQGELNKNTYNNNTLSRGLGRSSIATTGISSLDNVTANNVTGMNTQRQSALSAYDRTKAMLKNNLTNSLSSAESDYNSKLMEMANSLQQRQEDINYRNQQAANALKQQQIDNAYRNQQAEYAKSQDRLSQEWKQREWDASVAASANSTTKFNATDFRSGAISKYKQALLSGDTDAQTIIRESVLINNQADLNDYLDGLDNTIVPQKTNYSIANNNFSNIDIMKQYAFSQSGGLGLLPKKK